MSKYFIFKLLLYVFTVCSIYLLVMTSIVQDVNQVFLTKKKIPRNSTDVVSSSVSSSNSECLLITHG